MNLMIILLPFPVLIGQIKYMLSTDGNFEKEIACVNKQCWAQRVC